MKSQPIIYSLASSLLISSINSQICATTAYCQAAFESDAFCCGVEKCYTDYLQQANVCAHAEWSGNVDDKEGVTCDFYCPTS